MSKKLYVSGEFLGFCTLKNFSSVQDIDFSEIKWDILELQSISEIPRYDEDELKIGNYSYLEVFKNFNVSFKKTYFIELELHSIVLTNLEIENFFKVNGETFLKVKGDYFAKNQNEIKSIEESEIDLQLKISDDDYINIKTEEDYGDYLSKPSTTSGCLSNFNFFKGSKNSSSSNFVNAKSTEVSYVKEPNSSKIISVLGLFAIIFCCFYFNLGVILSVILIVIGLLITLSRFFPWLSKILRVILGLIIVLIVISIILAGLSNSSENKWQDRGRDKDENTEESEWVKEREREETKVKEGNVLVSYFMHNHNWKQNTGEKRFGKFKVEKNEYSISKSERNKLTFDYNSSLFFWNNVYNSLISQDKNSLNDIYELYDNIRQDFNLNRNEFADMVVSSIQWIPYVLVLEKSCEDSRYDGGFITEYLMEGKPCLGGIKFGLQSPVEFLSNFQGDCDTRSVTCYMILEKFGYDVAVLISEKYGHAILGINLNVGGGDYIKHKGKRYYVWETTSVGYGAGVIPRDCSNLNYWKVALNSNNK